MASSSGVLTEWPWSPLGGFKYLLVAPLKMASIHSYGSVCRIMHKTAKGKKKIVDKPIEFEQVDRGRSWDDQIIFNTLFMFLVNNKLSGCSRIPLWRLDGAILMSHDYTSCWSRPVLILLVPQSSPPPLPDLLSLPFFLTTTPPSSPSPSRYPKLKIRLVDGSSMAASVVVNSMEVVFRGNVTKVASAVVFALSQKGVKFPPNKLCEDCFYHSTPAMLIPKSAQNIHSCENWLGRRVMSGWRIVGIVHALEGWEEHDCGNTCNFFRLSTPYGRLLYVSPLSSLSIPLQICL
ncbi:unnamed protein product [Arabidopsis arenosa]|uniref:Very-long-chain aldehyde decarbonylase CER1-like C-terminal domain-containing protein n=1 Tax=Arabidopsis arenosa TaxID=38785 RepID=A0A8S1ZK92_ARAAE|nr:unnamed protein product [Arabidopsis arenosa]